MPVDCRAKDESGNDYGVLRVLRDSGKRGPSRELLWECECRCGNIVLVRGADLRNGKRVTCGSRKCKGEHRSKDERGNVYGSWTVLDRAETPGGRAGASWLCECSCGRRRVVVGSDLRSGGSKSCGRGRCHRDGRPAGESSKKQWLRLYKENAEKRGFKFTLSDEDAYRISQQPCTYCGELPVYPYGGYGYNGRYYANGLDRFDSREGYEAWNVVSCCPRCNMMKGSLTLDEFLGSIRAILKHTSKSLSARVVS